MYEEIFIDANIKEQFLQVTVVLLKEKDEFYISENVHCPFEIQNTKMSIANMENSVIKFILLLNVKLLKFF